MAEIHPFRGIRFNTELVGNIAGVICPPYDVISPVEQKGLYQKNQHNMVRVEFPVQMPGDAPPNTKHARAAATLNQWLKEGVLQRDNAPGIYIHEHNFNVGPSRKKRVDFTCCVKLEPWETKVVRPHENTVPGIKSDRLELMRACRVNSSPIMALYDDPGQKVAKVITGQTARLRLLADFNMNDDNHKFWVATDWEILQRLCHFLSPKQLFIADGHHRYETALAYQQERKARTPSPTGEEAFNFVMMSLISFSDPGLIVFPIHRLIRGASPEALAGLPGQLEKFFTVERLADETGESALKEGTICIVGLTGNETLALKARPELKLHDLMPKGRSDAYLKLDVSHAQHIIIERLLGTESGMSVSYTPSSVAARDQVSKGGFQMAILLPPISPARIKNIAEVGDRMPGKSTYFYPKLPTGLAINPLDGEV